MKLHTGMRVVRPVALTILLVWAAFGASAARGDSGVKLYSHVFSYSAGDDSFHRVVVAGDFNGWSQEATPMRRLKSGDYGVLVQLTEGVHLYKFLVDGRWVNDPHSDASLEESDGFGGKNSAALIGPDARKFPAPPPGKIVTELP
jgi:cyclomaltodextrinase